MDNTGQRFAKTVLTALPLVWRSSLKYAALLQAHRETEELTSGPLPRSRPAQSENLLNRKQATPLACDNPRRPLFVSFRRDCELSIQRTRNFSAVRLSRLRP